MDMSGWHCHHIGPHNGVYHTTNEERELQNLATAWDSRTATSGAILMPRGTLWPSDGVTRCRVFIAAFSSGKWPRGWSRDHEGESPVEWRGFGDRRGLMT